MYNPKIRDILKANDYYVLVEGKTNTKLVMTMPCGFPNKTKPQLNFDIIPEGFRVYGTDSDEVIEMPKYSIRLCVLTFMHYICNVIGYSPLYIFFQDRKGKDAKDIPLKLSLSQSDCQKESDLLVLYGAAAIDSFEPEYEKIAEEKDIIEGYNILLSLSKGLKNE